MWAEGGNSHFGVCVSVCVCGHSQERRLDLRREVGGQSRQTGRATPSPHGLLMPLGQILDKIF